MRVGKDRQAHPLENSILMRFSLSVFHLKPQLKLSANIIIVTQISIYIHTHIYMHIADSCHSMEKTNTVL